jgi:hypothetical protein
MTIQEQLLQEIQSAPDTILAETLNFLRFLKTKEIASAPKSTTHTPVKSTGNSLLEHLKTIGKWQGDDSEECLQQVIATRGEAKFDYNNPFE